MKRFLNLMQISSTIYLSFILSACGGGSSPPPPTETNVAPVANAGTDQNVSTGAQVTLDGSGSTDADGDSLTYTWTLTSTPDGSAASLTNATSAQATFVADMAGTYNASLVVNDGRVSSSADTVVVTASSSNTAPVANAGPDQNVTTGTQVALDGSGSTDADGDSLSYSWSLVSVPNGSTATLSDTTSVQPTFVADLDGTYNVSLVVNDGSDNSAPDSVDVTASTPNNAPVANAGSNQNVSTGTLVTLNGNGSTDADGDSLTYTWTLTSTPDGSAASLTNATSAQATFVADMAGTYNASLVVNDGRVSSSADTVVVTASSSNTAPVANAGPDQNVTTGTQVALDGSGSTDADGDSLSYSWSLVSVPNGSTATLSDTTSVQPTFVADLDGTYNVSLVVNDGSDNSAPDSVDVTASTPNNAPVANAGSNQNVSTGTLVTLNGNGSTDADGDALTYAWTLDSIPGGSTASLNNASSVQASFTADVDGTYTASLVVNDGIVNSSADSVTITASSGGVGISPRTPSALTIKQIHSGHSLTDTAMFAQPWPGHSIHMWTELNPSGDYFNLLGKSTIPGSPMSWRWNNLVCCGSPDARHDIADWELLVITEGVPFILNEGTDPGSAWYRDHLDWMRIWVEHAWNNGNNGNGIPTLLYATWTDLAQGESQWRAELDTYQPLWEQMADFGAENLPDEAFVYIIPGNLLMMRLYDDIQAGNVPGVTSITDFFTDTIPPNGLGSYALALLHIAVIHHINPDVMGHTGYSLTPEPSSELAEYLQAVTWEIATSYDRAGVPGG